MKIHLFVLLVLFSGCTKYLDKTPDKSLNTPSTYSDLRGILDNNSLLNADYPVAGAIASDFYYVTDNNLASISDPDAKADYIWNKDLSTGLVQNLQDWEYTYQMIFSVNVVLDNLNKVSPDGVSDADLMELKGEALFYRGFALLKATQVYTLPYNVSTSETIPGMPLKLTSDINEPILRASVQKTYDQITADLINALPFLPASNSPKLRPNKFAAFATLANVYLITGKFQDALNYADSCLALNSTLIDYNTIDTTANPEFALFNDEVEWQADLSRSIILYGAYAQVDTVLYSLYAANDLRKSVFFLNNGDGTYMFQANYNGRGPGWLAFFCGIATDEVYLIKAECQARLGDPDGAMATLNKLLQNRYLQGTFLPLTASSAADALSKIILERRKELCFRGDLRWMDLRRLSQEPALQATISRTVNGQKFSLVPGDLHYAFPIPQPVIDNSKVAQNLY